MENTEVDKSSASEDTSQLSRNRSFKSNKLVRSQAIRESQSPPRAISPSPAAVAPPSDDDRGAGAAEKESSSSELSEDARKLPVEIQITQGAWDETPSEQRQRTRRWLGNKQPSSRDLLSNNPRVACVCGACSACPHCRGRRRRNLCPTKQDSGIVCSDECPDCSDTDTVSGSSNYADGGRKSNSLDVDDQSSYCRCPERKEKPKSISLSRTDSDEKSEPTGPELVNFIKETLNKNARDRMTLLKIEKELHALVNDTGRCIVRFPVMTSYGRMLVHRCASLFQLSHHLDQTNKSAVLVSKTGTSGGRLPCTSFKQWCTANFPPSPQRHQSDVTNAKSILKRDTHSLDEPGAGGASAGRSKSLEQRVREYERVRRRIFSGENCTQDEANQWQWLNSGPVKLLTSEGGRNKLLKVQSLEGGSNTGSNPSRGPVSKSHSFGGYGRGQDPPRVLSRQGDLASSSWRLSPSSSGYRTLSLHSTDSVTPSPTGGASPEPTQPSRDMCVMWCVTDLSSVPPGAALIHPQTGQPLTNPDGSLYHFDPAHPPPLADLLPPDHTVETNNEKKRGRLEKQHSFMDSECDCQPTEECRSKCCCECRQHDSCHKNNTEKVESAPEQKIHQKPLSPSKNRYEPPTTTNHNPPADVQTNQRSPYELPTNQSAAPETPTNQRSPYENQEFSNQRSAYDAQTFIPQYSSMQSIPVNYNPYDNQNRFDNRAQSYESNQKFELANQRVEMANQRPMKLPTPEVQYIAQQYQQTFSHEEMTTPPVAPHYLQPDLAAQMAVKPMHLQDPNMAPMVYGGGMTRSPLPVYGTFVPQQEDKHDHRIDPSYGYTAAAADYSCSGCYGEATPAPTAAHYAVYSPLEVLPYQHAHIAHRRYPEQVQWAGIPPLLTAPPPKVFAPALYPIMPPQPAPYNLLYPQTFTYYAQMIPQPYPLVQPAYPVTERAAEPRRNSFSSQRHSKRNSVSGSSRNTPLTSIPQSEEKKVPYDDSQSQNAAQNVNIPGQNINIPGHSATIPGHNANIPGQNANIPGQNANIPSQNANIPGQNVSTVNMSNQNAGMPQQSQSRVNDSNEIAAKIQQIKEQMAQLHTREGDRDRRGAGGEARGEYRRRNGGNGILGSHPGAPQARFSGRPTNDESQLSSAARAIVNSIRSMQAKNTAYQDRRGEYNNYSHSGGGQPYRTDKDRPDFRRRDERPDRTDRPDRRLPIYRPSYLLRQMSPGTWCRRSPAPVHPVLNTPRRPPPDNRNIRR